VLAVLRKTPALPRIMKRLQQAKGGAVIDKGDVGLPGKLNQRAAPVGKALGEVARRNIHFPEHSPGFKIIFAQSGVPIQSGAFVEMAVQVDQALRERIRVMRICVDDAIAVRLLRLTAHGAKQEQENQPRDSLFLHRPSFSRWRAALCAANSAGVGIGSRSSPANIRRKISNISSRSNPLVARISWLSSRNGLPS